MLVESGGNNKAVGDGGTSFGLFQLHQGGELPAGWTPEQAFDPRANAEVALSVFAQQNGSDPGQIAASAQRPAIQPDTQPRSMETSEKRKKSLPRSRVRVARRQSSLLMKEPPRVVAYLQLVHSLQRTKMDNCGHRPIWQASVRMECRLRSIGVSRIQSGRNRLHP